MTPTFLPDSRRHPGDIVLDYLAMVPTGQLLLGSSGWLALVAEQLPLANPARIAARVRVHAHLPGIGDLAPGHSSRTRTLGCSPRQSAHHW